MQTVMTAFSTSKLTSLPLDPPLPQRAVAEVFRSLNAQFGAKLADLYAGVPAADVQAEWATRLAGFRRHELERGLAACAARTFAPTLGEFAAQCRPALDPEQAWWEAEACMRQRDEGAIGDWTHPAIYRAACSMPFELRGGDLKQNRKRWAAALKRELAVGFGDGVPPPAIRVEQTVKTGPPSKAILEQLRALRATLRPTPGS